MSALLSVELTHLPNKQLFSVGQVCVWFHELTYKLTCTHTNTRVYARTHARANKHAHTMQVQLLQADVPAVLANRPYRELVEAFVRPTKRFSDPLNRKVHL